MQQQLASSIPDPQSRTLMRLLYLLILSLAQWLDASKKQPKMHY